MSKVTFLAPYGATFTHDAYMLLSERYGVPKANSVSYVPVAHNRDVLPALLEHHGYGTVAMKTMAEGRNDEPVESFINLLRTFPNNTNCPLAVVGLVRMPVHFHLMRRAEYRDTPLTQVLAHTKALGACQAQLAQLGVEVCDVSSNGEAARLVAESDEYAMAGALGPRSAADMYRLAVLREGLEDRPAVTEFVLIGPQTHTAVSGDSNRAFLIFEVPHHPLALCKVLEVIGREEFNLLHIHSVHVEGDTYHFMAEVSVPGAGLSEFGLVVSNLREYTTRQLVFGPFEEYDA